MEHDQYVEIRVGENYERIIQSDGVRTTVCLNRFEIIAQPNCEVWEQHAVQHLREWIRTRKEKELQAAGGVPR
jgi:hypothetical protein